MRATLALDGLINTHSQKLGYTLKLFTLVDTLDCNFLGITNTKISINHKLLSHHNLSIFVGKIYCFLYFWRIDRTPTPILFVGESALIHQYDLFHFFVTTNEASNKNNFKLENASLTKLRIKD